MPSPIKLLLIEDDPAQSRLVQEMLSDSKTHFVFEAAHKLSDGLARLDGGDFDAVLLDLELPDSTASGTVSRIKSVAQNLPIVVMTNLDDKDLAIRAMKDGAQDFLFKSDIDTGMLVRTILYAIERHRRRSGLRQERVATSAATANVVQDLRRQLAASQARFQNVIGKNADGFVIVKQDGLVHFANEAAKSLFGREADQLIGRRFGFPLVAGESSELELIRPGGEPVVAEMRVVRIEWDGELAVLASIRDISLRKQLEEELKRSNEELEEFARIISHDLKQPLRSIKGFIQLLRDNYLGKLDEKAEKFMQLVVEGADRMSHLIRDLLEYARLNVDPKGFKRIDSQNICKHAIANLEAAIQEGGAEVSYDDLPPLYGDAAQLGQVFQNLIGNAIKFHGDEPLKVHISAERKGATYLFRIDDNGIGMDPEDIDRIFQVFQRLHTAEEYPGTGIGLSTCKKVVELHGGRIWVESEPGKGSTFFFEIPVKN